ncbi:hypothetical protein GTO10_06725 [Candidatus Saccharibacteria bacterium]|nr:hypothetical protein [Candidatus Saccharibacteria bacterium]
MKIKLTLPTIGLLEASGLTAYVVLISKIFQYADKWAAGISPTSVSVFLLLLFVLSALISALIMLGRPALLFFDGKKKEAVELVLWSTIWLAGFITIFLFFIL